MHANPPSRVTPAARATFTRCPLWLSLAVAMLAPLTSPAFAQTSDPATAQEGASYDQLIELAVQEFRLGHYPEALGLFEQAHEAEPSARTLRGMGMAAFEQRAYVLAIQHLRAALTDTRKPLTDEQRAQVENLLERARSYVAQYDLELTPSDAEVSVDSKPAVIVDGTLLLDPGTHELTVSVGEQRERRQVRAQPNERLVLRIRLSASPKSEADEEEAASAGLSPRRKWAIATASVGGAALAAGLGLTLYARSLREDAGCSDGVCPDAAAVDTHDKAVTNAHAATAAVAVGVAAVGAGVALWLWPERDESSRAGMRVSVAGSRGFAGFSLNGQF